MIEYFEYKHLPPHLQEVSKNFYDLAHHLRKNLPYGAEHEMALRKLLEAKDCAVRVAVSKHKVQMMMQAEIEEAKEKMAAREIKAALKDEKKILKDLLK